MVLRGDLELPHAGPVLLRRVAHAEGARPRRRRHRPQLRQPTHPLRARGADQPAGDAGVRLLHHRLGPAHARRHPDCRDVDQRPGAADLDDQPDAADRLRPADAAPRDQCDRLHRDAGLRTRGDGAAADLGHRGARVMMSAGITLLLFILLAFGMPVAFALVVSGSIGLYLIGGLDVLAGVITTTPLSTAGSYELISIPMFILMAEFVILSGVADDLFRAASTWV